METIRTDEQHAVDATVASLRAGHVAVVPTDTVYGLAARPDDDAAVERIYEAKGRPPDLHLPVLAASLEQVRGLGVAFTPAATALAERWWPGPLTLAFSFDAEFTRPSWLAGRDEVAVRLPDHAFLRAVMERTGVLLVTSANPHGGTTPPLASEVAAALGPMVRLLVDGGVLSATPSTVVNVTHGGATVEREGAIATADIAAAVAGTGGSAT